MSTVYNLINKIKIVKNYLQFDLLLQGDELDDRLVFILTGGNMKFPYEVETSIADKRLCDYITIKMKHKLQ